MTVFSKRNALVGFLTLKALERRRHRQKRHAWKLVTFVVLGIVSAGILAAVAAAVLRRQRDASEETQHLQGYAVADDTDGLGSTELDGGVPEPGYAA